MFERQKPDGGWSWVKENKTSDAFATGQALYALSLVGRDERRLRAPGLGFLAADAR